MELIHILFFKIFKFLNQTFIVFGYEISFFQMLVVSALLIAISALWYKLQN